MSKLPLRGRPKAVAADFCQLLNSPSAKKDMIPILSHEIVLASHFSPPFLISSIYGILDQDRDGMSDLWES